MILISFSAASITAKRTVCEEIFITDGLFYYSVGYHCIPCSPNGIGCYMYVENYGICQAYVWRFGYVPLGQD